MLTQAQLLKRPRHRFRVRPGSPIWWGIRISEHAALWLFVVLPLCAGAVFAVVLILAGIINAIY